jgi:hypothetical protein
VHGDHTATSGGFVPSPATLDAEPLEPRCGVVVPAEPDDPVSGLCGAVQRRHDGKGGKRDDPFGYEPQVEEITHDHELVVGTPVDERDERALDGVVDALQVQVGDEDGRHGADIAW